MSEEKGKLYRQFEWFSVIIQHGDLDDRLLFEQEHCNFIDSEAVYQNMKSFLDEAAKEYLNKPIFTSEETYEESSIDLLEQEIDFDDKWFEKWFGTLRNSSMQNGERK